MVLVVGLYVFVGNSGVLSFGQMSFMSIGAYTTALITIPLIQKNFLLPDLPSFLANAEISPLPAALIAGAAALVFGLILVVPIVRLSGLAASLAMFAVLVIVYQVAINWDAVTRGSRTMIGVPTNTTIWVAMGWAVVMIVMAYLHQRSSTGLRLRASREDEFAARAAGINIPRERGIAFLLSAFIIGVGGFLYAQFQGAFTPSAFFIHITFLTIAMLVGGGREEPGRGGDWSRVGLGAELRLQLDRGRGERRVRSTSPVGMGSAIRRLRRSSCWCWYFRRDGIMRGREFRWRWPLRRGGGGGEVTETDKERRHGPSRPPFGAEISSAGALSGPRARTAGEAGSLVTSGAPSASASAT